MNRQYIIGSIAACLGLGYLAYHFSDDGKGVTAQPSQSLTKSQTMSILKDLRNELMQVYMTMASFASSIKEQTGYRIGDNEIREILLTQTPIQSQIKKAELKVYDKHRTSEESFKFACEKAFADDIEVQDLMAEMKQNLENSFKGLPPKMPTHVPDFLTADLTLKIMQEMNDASKLCMYEIIEDIRAKGIAMSQSNPQFQMELEKSSARIEQEQYKVFEKHGLTEFDQPATILIQSAMQKYSQTNPNFISKFAQDQESMNYAMQMIMQGTFPREEIQAIRDRLRGRPLIEELEEPREVVEEQFLNEDEEEDITLG